MDHSRAERKSLAAGESLKTLYYRSPVSPRLMRAPGGVLIGIDSIVGADCSELCSLKFEVAVLLEIAFDDYRLPNQAK
jgi:hypothetical protein